MSYDYNGAEYSASDMQRKFSGTWLLLKEHGVVFIDSFSDSEFYFSTNTTSKVVPRADFIVESEFPDVDVMVNYKKVCALINRVPRRQWQAGLTKNTLQAVSPIGSTFFQERHMTQEFVSNLFHPKYPEMDAIYNAVSKDSSVSLSFDGKYWLCNSKGTIQLWRKSYKIGDIVKVSALEYNITLDEFCLSMEQELKDEVKHVRFNIIKPV